MRAVAFICALALFAVAAQAVDFSPEAGCTLCKEVRNPCQALEGFYKDLQGQKETLQQQLDAAILKAKEYGITDQIVSQIKAGIANQMDQASIVSKIINSIIAEVTKAVGGPVLGRRNVDLSAIGGDIADAINAVTGTIGTIGTTVVPEIGNIDIPGGIDSIDIGDIGNILPGGDTNPLEAIIGKNFGGLVVPSTIDGEPLSISMLSNLGSIFEDKMNSVVKAIDASNMFNDMQKAIDANLSNQSDEIKLAFNQFKDKSYQDVLNLCTDKFDMCAPLCGSSTVEPSPAKCRLSICGLTGPLSKLSSVCEMVEEKIDEVPIKANICDMIAMPELNCNAVCDQINKVIPGKCQCAGGLSQLSLEKIKLEVAKAVESAKKLVDSVKGDVEKKLSELEDKASDLYTEKAKEFEDFIKNKKAEMLKARSAASTFAKEVESAVETVKDNAGWQELLEKAKSAVEALKEKVVGDETATAGQNVEAYVKEALVNMADIAVKVQGTDITGLSESAKTAIGGVLTYGQSLVDKLSNLNAAGSADTVADYVEAVKVHEASKNTAVVTASSSLQANFNAAEESVDRAGNLGNTNTNGASGVQASMFVTMVAAVFALLAM